MKKISIVIFAALLLFMPGCGLLTLHPIFTPGDLVVDNRLQGKWKAGDGYTEFAPATKVAMEEIPEKLRPFANKFYLCTRRSDDGTTGSRDLAFLVKIGNNYFLDMYPLQTDDTKRIDEFFTSHELKMHTISKLEFTGRNIRLIGFKDNYVEDLIKNREVRIRHSFVSSPEESEEKKIVITASTKELQAFLLKYGDRKEAYDTNGNENTYRKIN
ncbi:MAG: hypothetical protein ACXVBH_06140 [Flavisolibacter sp.]